MITTYITTKLITAHIVFGICTYSITHCAKECSFALLITISRIFNLSSVALNFVRGLAGMWALLCVLTLTICCVHQTRSKLVHVHLLYRHGDRSPTNIYPKDRYTPATWKDGLGWLTSEGIQQHYEFGEILRQRYVHDTKLLSPRYNHTELYVRSTDYPRTLMSAESNLAGLYPPAGDQLWNKRIMWQPIPVHTEKLSSDSLLNGGFEGCPRATQLRADIMKSKEVVDIERKDHQFFKHISQMTGVDATLGNLYHIHDVLFCEQSHNRTLPDWATAAVLSKLEYYNDVTYKLTYGNEELRKLRGGVLIKQIIEDMADVSCSRNRTSRRMTMYSAHDVTVMALLNSLHVFDGNWPHYTAAVIVELHKNESGTTPFVRIFYRHSPQENPPRRLQLPGCATDCPLPTLHRILMQEMMAPGQYTAACLAKGGVLSFDEVPFFALIAAMAVLCFVVTLLIVKVCRATKQLVDSQYTFSKLT